MTTDRTTSRTRLLVAAALAASLPIALGACDGGSGGEPTETVTAHSTVTPSSPSSSSSRTSTSATTSSEATSTTATGTSASTAPGGAADACAQPPTDPDEYGDLYVRAWGVGDVESMRCLAAAEAVSYTVDYRAEAGPGWIRLDATGGQTRTVRYGAPNRKTTLTLTVDGSRTGRGQAITTAVIG